jgi:hypothetical protein
MKIPLLRANPCDKIKAVYHIYQTRGAMKR